MTDQSVKILEAALKLYTSKPPHEVTIEEIASKAGVSKSLVFYYFEDKDNLEKEVANYTFKQLLREWKENVNSVVDLIDLTVKNFTELPYLIRFWAYIGGKALYHGEYEFFKGLFEETMEFVTPLFEKERIADPEKTAIILMAMFDGLSLYSLFYDIGDIEDYRRIAMEFIECRRLGE
jgi:AcrR family transcriptional regulator